MKWLPAILIILIASPAFAAGTTTGGDVSGAMTAVRNSMVVLCFIIAIITMAVKASVNGEAIDNRQMFLRLFFVVVALMAAGSIQGLLRGTGESLAASYLPGASIVDVQSQLLDKVKTVKNKQGGAANPTSFDEIDWWNPKKAATGFFNVVSYHMQMLVEMVAVTVFFLIFKWFQAMTDVVMNLLAVMGPLMIAASIIPGIKGFSNWIKLVCAVSLWPVIAAFFVKAHLATAGSFIGSGTQIFSTDPSNLFLNMDGLQMLGECVITAIFLVATPFIAMAIVSGSAGAFSVGSAMLIGAMPAALIAPVRETINSMSSRSSTGRTGIAAAVGGAVGAGSRVAGRAVQMMRNQSSNQSVGTGEPASARYAEATPRKDS